MRGLASAIAVICLALTVPVGAEEPAATPIWRVPAVPALLPATTLEDTAGRDVPLGSGRTKATVFHFWATWCAPCVAELPALATLATTLAPQGVVVLAVSEDHGGARDVGPFLERRPVSGSMAMVLDPRRTLAKSLGVGLVPTTIIFGADGLERARLTGSGDWSAADGRRLADALR